MSPLQTFLAHRPATTQRLQFSPGIHLTYPLLTAFLDANVRPLHLIGNPHIEAGVISKPTYDDASRSRKWYQRAMAQCDLAWVRINPYIDGRIYVRQRLVIPARHLLVSLLCICIYTCCDSRMLISN